MTSENLTQVVDRLSILSLTCLKIDMRFISDMMTNVSASTIVESSIALAKTHGQDRGTCCNEWRKAIERLFRERGAGRRNQPKSLDNTLKRETEDIAATRVGFEMVKLITKPKRLSTPLKLPPLHRDVPIVLNDVAR